MPAPPMKVSSRPTNGTSPTASAQPVRVDHIITSGITEGAQATILYGPGGVGKSTLASLMPGNTLFLDLGRGTRNIKLNRIDTITTWQGLRAVLASSLVDPFDSIVVDGGTEAEEFDATYTMQTVPHDKTGKFVDRLEGYGWGKGYGHVYETFLPLLGDLDRLRDKGKNVTLICHVCTANAPNPEGEDYLRWEPSLQNQNKANLRNRVVAWADHVLFIGYDVMASDGKAKGQGTRTIQVQERPTWVAKSRTLADPIPWNDPTDGTLWAQMFAQKESES